MSALVRAFILLLMLMPVAASALEVPALKGRVNDYADMISPETEKALEEKLKAFEESDSTQVVILTVDSLEGDSLEDFSIRVAEKWKIGQAKKDNGVIFTVVKTYKLMRIEVGRGLEGVLTDLLAGRILDNIVKPKFRAGDFDGGFTDGTGAIIEACRGEFKGDGSTASAESGGTSETLIYIICFILYFVIIVTAGISKLLSGGIGAVSLPAIIHFGFAPLGLAEFGAAAVAGFIIALILPYLPLLSFLGGGGSGGSGGSFSGGGGSFGGGGSSGGW